VYYTIAEQYNKKNRPDDKWHGGRPIILSMQAPHNEISGYNVDENPLVEGAMAEPLDPMFMAESPAHHKYPVWWNGDFATMNNNLEAMVDGGVHDFKPYVHPDCGGDGWFTTVIELLRQTQMCSFGTILRFHGGPHQPWIYGDWWEDNIRHYIKWRYMFMPMIIAGGQRATKTGFPFVARCDLYWPEHGNSSSSNHQYMFLDDILVAPIFDSSGNYTERDVWIPPGAWQDAWSGEVVYGPEDITVGQPQNRMPMWIRMDGGMLIYTDKPGLTVADGDWSTLVAEVWPCRTAHNTSRTIYERSTEDSPPSQNVTFSTDGSGTATIKMTKSDHKRAWVVRVHLLVGQTVVSASVDGKPIKTQEYMPNKADDGTLWHGYLPFGGEGSVPAGKAGNVVELKMSATTSARKVEVVMSGGKKPEKNVTAPQAKSKAKLAPEPDQKDTIEFKIKRDHRGKAGYRIHWDSLRIASVEPDGPAYRAGLREGYVGSIITHLDGLELTAENAKAAVAATREPDRTFTVRVKGKESPAEEGAVGALRDLSEEQDKDVLVKDVLVKADASVHVPWTSRPSTEGFTTAGIASAGLLALLMLSAAAVRRLGASCQLAEAPIPEDAGALLMEAA
jgi:hypothetical protein